MVILWTKYSTGIKKLACIARKVLLAPLDQQKTKSWYGPGALGWGSSFWPRISVRLRTDRPQARAYAPRVRGGDNAMRTFQCLNEKCEEESPVGAIDWIDNQHIVQCWLCGQGHALNQLTSENDAPIRFAVTGLGKSLSRKATYFSGEFQPRCPRPGLFLLASYTRYAPVQTN